MRPFLPSLRSASDSLARQSRQHTRLALRHQVGPTIYRESPHKELTSNHDAGHEM
jgi:hypothetical protein